jgi:hypothetical protein
MERSRISVLEASAVLTKSRSQMKSSSSFNELNFTMFFRIFFLMTFDKITGE